MSLAGTCRTLRHGSRLDKACVQTQNRAWQAIQPASTSARNPTFLLRSLSGVRADGLTSVKILSPRVSRDRLCQEQFPRPSNHATAANGRHASASDPWARPRIHFERSPTPTLVIIAADRYSIALRRCLAGASDARLARYIHISASLPSAKRGRPRRSDARGSHEAARLPIRRPWECPNASRAVQPMLVQNARCSPCPSPLHLETAAALAKAQGPPEKSGRHAVQRVSSTSRPAVRPTELWWLMARKVHNRIDRSKCSDHRTC